MAFAKQLKKLMDVKNMRAVELARSTGLSEAAISDYLKGKKEPRGRQSIAIAKALAVSLDTLWETEFRQDMGILDGYETSCPDAAKLNEAVNLFKTLRPDLQDYALEQIKKLAELQEKKEL